MPIDSWQLAQIIETTVGSVIEHVGSDTLIHWGLNKMVDILQESFLKTCSGMTIIVFCTKLHWRVQIAHSLAPVYNAKPFPLWNDCQVQWCINASPVLNVLTLERPGLYTYGPKITPTDDGLTSNSAKPSTDTWLQNYTHFSGFFSCQWFKIMFLLIRWYSKWPMRSCEIILHINIYCMAPVSF